MLQTIFETAVTKFSNLLLAVSLCCLIFMMGHVVLDVFLKFAFNAPLIGTLETVSYYYMVGAVFLPLGAVELKKEHVHVDLFIQFFSPRFRLVALCSANLLGIVYFGGLFYQTLLDAITSFGYKETIMSNYLFYVWPSRWALPIGFLAMALALMLSTTYLFNKRLTHSPQATDPEDDLVE